MSSPGPTVVFCTACGAHNAPDARFCQTCGKPMMPVVPVPVTGSIAAYVSQSYGGFWIRVLAWLIDWAIICAVVLPLIFLSSFALHGISALPALCAGWLYFALLTSSSKQATIGKMALGMRVTDLNGQRINFGRATLRYFSKILSGMLLGFGYLMVAFTDRKQGLHDMIAGTLVVKG
jgi:uncharacterized RDD family membrane protein YckC